VKTLATIATRDALLTALRDAPHPLSTAELAAALPWHREQVVHHGTWYHREAEHLKLVLCAGEFDVVDFRPYAAHVYPHLAALAATGQVGQVRVAGMRTAYWTAAQQPGVTVGQLDAMWSA